jgi:hypothetical protein
MKFTAFVIKCNNKGNWEYYYERANGATSWDLHNGVYGATKFKSRLEAETLLDSKIKG